MDTLAGRFVRARDGERATKESSKCGMEEFMSQIATYELGMLSAKWPKGRVTLHK